jgi:hypothetical protein
MTEAEWLACEDPRPMLDALPGTASDRKLRLFVCACCHRIWQLLPDPPTRSAVETAERFSDGLASQRELHAAREAAYQAFVRYTDSDESGRFTGRESAAAAAAGACWAGTEDRARGLDEVVDNTYGLGRLLNGRRVEWRQQSDSLRDIFGNPFRPVTLGAGWRTPEVVAMAQGIYDDRAFDRLPLLGDVLGRLGCGVAEVLAHCRSGDEHARGCWVVDAVLGKA